VAELQRKFSELEAMNELDRIRAVKTATNTNINSSSAHLPPLSGGSKLRPPSMGLQVDVSVEESDNGDSDDWVSDYTDRSPRNMANTASSQQSQAKSVSSTATTDDNLNKSARPSSLIRQFSLVSANAKLGSVKPRQNRNTPSDQRIVNKQALKQSSSFYHLACGSPYQTAFNNETPRTEASGPASVRDDGREFFVNDHAPIGLIELGEFACRVSIYSHQESKFLLK
jgi:hypothetical protein